MVRLDQADSPAAYPITVAVTRANAEGEFVVAQVPQGAYRVRVDTSPRNPSSAPAMILSGTTSIVVDRDTENVSLSVRPVLRFAGKSSSTGAADQRVHPFSSRSILPTDGRARGWRASMSASS
jgi:hypothetical protein